MNKDKDNSNKSGKGKRGLESPDKGLPSDKKSCLNVGESAKESVKQTEQEDPMEVFRDCVGDDSENVGGSGSGSGPGFGSGSKSGGGFLSENGPSHASPHDQRSLPQLSRSSSNISTNTCDDSLAQLVLAKLSKLDSIDHKLNSIDGAVRELRSDFAANREYVDELRGQLSTACEEIDELKCQVGRLDKLESEIEYLKERNSFLEGKVVRQEMYSRRENILIHGIVEKEGEDCFKLVEGVFKRLQLESLNLSRCHRLKNGKRPIIARFANFQDKLRVMKSRKLLRGSNIYINDDVTPEIARKQDDLFPVVSYLKSKDNKSKATVVNGSIKVHGKLYKREPLSDLDINLSEVGLNCSNTHVAFAGGYCPLSNLYSCEITIHGSHYIVLSSIISNKNA